MSQFLPVGMRPLPPDAHAGSARRTTDRPRTPFADSLATASAEKPSERAREASAEKPSERAREAAAARPRRAAPHDAHVLPPRLEGAIKSDVSAFDVPPKTPVLTAVVASLPAVPCDASTECVTSDETHDAMSPVDMPGIADRLCAPATITTTRPNAVAIDVILASMPAPVQSIDVPPESGSELGPELDSTASITATMPLIASLSMLLPPMTLPATPESPTDSNPGTERGAREFERAAISRPDVPAGNDTSTATDNHSDAAGAARLYDSSHPTLVPMASSMPAEPTAAAALSDRARAAASVVKPETAAGIERDTARLDPAFRERLERVMERMRKEFGHAVTVVETVRSQTRQNALFEQGRTTAGQVVTWTRDSRHSIGKAADLIVDGEWQNARGYAHLAEIARQEGLRTLGARDPGHVELPSDGSVSGESLGALLGDLTGEAGDTARQLRAGLKPEHHSESNASAMARVANVAQVARVATVASVAKVSTVASPGESPRRGHEANEATSPLAVSGAVPMAGATDLAGSVRVVTPAGAVNMADRISQLMDLQATQASKPLNSVLLRMENPDGLDDQLRIDTRGTSVDARLGLGNAQQATALTDRLSELREALERRGLNADGLRVQSASSMRTTDTATFARTVAPTVELAAMRAASDNQAQGNLRDQAARDQQRHESLARDSSRHTPRSSSDDTRHRSRREQPEDRR